MLNDKSSSVFLLRKELLMFITYKVKTSISYRIYV